MNQHLMKAQDAAGNAEAVLSAVDELFMDEADSNLQRLVMTALNLIKTVNSELDLLAQDRRVVDAIYAANDARHSQGSGSGKLVYSWPLQSEK